MVRLIRGAWTPITSDRSRIPMVVSVIGCGALHDGTGPIDHEAATLAGGAITGIYHGPNAVPDSGVRHLSPMTQQPPVTQLAPHRGPSATSRFGSYERRCRDIGSHSGCAPANGGWPISIGRPADCLQSDSTSRLHLVDHSETISLSAGGNWRPPGLKGCIQVR